MKRIFVGLSIYCISMNMWGCGGNFFAPESCHYHRIENSHVQDVQKNLPAPAPQVQGVNSPKNRVQVMVTIVKSFSDESLKNLLNSFTQ